MSTLIIEDKIYYLNGELYQHYFLKNGKKDGLFKEYDNHLNKLIYECYYKNDKRHGEYKLYDDTEGKLNRHFFYKDGKKDGKYKHYYQNEQLFICCFYKNDKINGEYKLYNKRRELTEYTYFIDDYIVTDKFNFKIKFALLKFRDILKNKVRKPIYNELDKYNIKDISNIIGLYLFTISNININGNRILS
jgi:antitoxin component YwqK of YwqJK toxin-antitoxin module